MLCFDSGNKFGEICTNRCSDYSNCPHKKLPSYRRIPFLVEAVDRIVSEIKPEVIDGLNVITYKPYCFTPQAFINGATDEITEPNSSDMRISRM